VDLLFQRAPDPVILHDNSGSILDVNQRATEYLDYTREELLSLTLPDIVPDVVGANGRSRWEDMIEGQTLVRETLHRRKSGELVPVAVHTTAIHWKGQRYYLGFVRDLTERRRAEQALLESEDKFRTIFEEAPHGIALADPETGLIVDCNRALCALVGREREELLGQPQSLLHPPSALDAGRSRTFQQHATVGAGATLRDQVLTKAGEVREVEIKAERLRVQGRDLLQGFFQDVTDRLRAEAALLASEEKYRTLFGNLSDVVYRTDPAGNLTLISPGVRAMLGYEPEELLGRPIASLYEDPSRRGAVLQALRRRGSVENFAVRLCRSDGTLVWASANAKELRDGHGRAAGVEGILRDVTPLKQAEEERDRLESQLRQSQKMEAIGTLCGGIAHDFNNILTPIMAYADFALLRTPADNPVRDDLAQLLRSAERARDLVRQILVVSRPDDDGAQVPVNLHALVKETAKLLQASLPSSIEIRTDLTPGCGRVRGEPSRLHQVLLNLCTNARDAMGGKGGVLTLSLARATEAEIPRGETAANPPRNWLKLAVSDTGPGIPPEVLERIFEPYFTTKPRGKGTGLGLAVARGAVAALGGEIRVRSTPGAGASFVVFLPEAPEEATLPSAPAGVLLSGNGEQVLVVDDEAPIRVVAHKILTALRYRVTACATGAEALGAFRARPGGFALVVTDYTMPGMSGLDLASELLRDHPDLPV
ncbi:MAG: PAS domain S-box protein, partial [Proteobacteria bacterium]|nr:PAS domain S-box protein [Pseudomonadota bacterium]